MYILTFLLLLLLTFILSLLLVAKKIQKLLYTSEIWIYSKDETEIATYSKQPKPMTITFL